MSQNGIAGSGTLESAIHCSTPIEQVFGSPKDSCAGDCIRTYPGHPQLAHVTELEHAPDYLSVYLAYVDGQPAACGWARFPAGSPFASLWGGSTLPEQRGRGLYASLLATLGMNPRKKYRLPGGRPLRLADKGKVIRELFN